MAFSRPTLFQDLAKSLVVEGRVIWALLLRETLTRYGRHNIGVLWLFVEPMLFTLGVTTLWTLTGLGHGSSLPIAAFAITGYSSVLLWRNMPSRCVGAVEPNASLMYHRNVKLMDIYISRVLLEGAGSTISFTILSLFFWYLGWIDLPEDVLKVIGGWFMLGWFGASLGIFIGALSERSEIIDKLWHPTTYLLFPLSGAGFMVSGLSPAFQKVVLTLPMVHGVEYLREGFFGSKVHSIYDMSYMASFNLALTILGLIQVRYLSRKVIPS
ncbi:ABC transporter permease [Sphingobium limneticum]|jgi:ABC-type polysaccharide/polyol phosphate export permease|uniref:ABC transporter permease n=1 Tax=Sphingobium TaxID=165695 RepID=UPI0031379548